MKESECDDIARSVQIYHLHLITAFTQRVLLSTGQQRRFLRRVSAGMLLIKFS